MNRSCSHVDSCSHKWIELLQRCLHFLGIGGLRLDAGQLAEQFRQAVVEVLRAIL